MDHRHYDVAAISAGRRDNINKSAAAAEAMPGADLPFIECQRVFNLAQVHFDEVFFTLINDGMPHRDILIAAAKMLGQALGNVLCRTSVENRATLYDHCAEAFDRVLEAAASPAETQAANPGLIVETISPLPGGSA